MELLFLGMDRSFPKNYPSGTVLKNKCYWKFNRMKCIFSKTKDRQRNDEKFRSFVVFLKILAYWYFLLQHSVFKY